MKQRHFSIIIGLALSMIAGGCTDFNDQFEGVEESAKPTNLASYAYTLTEADYGTIASSAYADAANAEDSAKIKTVKDNKYFTETAPASDYVPYLLEQMYKYSDFNSSAMITYAFGQDKPSYIGDLRTVNILNTDDYKKAWGSEVEFVNAFTPAVSPTDSLPKVLAAKFSDAKKGQYKFVEYNYSSKEADTEITEVEYVAEDFESYASYDETFEGWINKDIAGSRTWQVREYSNNLYVQVSSFGSGAINSVYLITPEIDLSNATAPEFTFDIKVRFYNESCLTVWMSEDFDGTEANIESATWIDITSNFTLPKSEADLTSAGVLDLTDYVGKQVYVGFRYDGDNSPGADPLKTTTYQIDNVKVSEVKVALTVDKTEKQYVAYTYNGSAWGPANATFVALQPADYSALGMSYISSANASLYLPNFLRTKFPYALEGDTKTVIYKSGSNQTYSGAVDYKFVSGQWVTEDFMEEKSEQFIFSTTGWLFDPTVNYSFVKDDYQLMVDYVKNSISPNYIDSYGNAEFYYGFASFYSNISFRLSYRDAYAAYDTELAALQTAEEKVALLHERLKEGMMIFAQLRFPEAVPTVSGIEVYYNITGYLYYPTGTASGNEYHTYRYKCTAAASGGNPPTFEFDSDYVVQ